VFAILTLCFALASGTQARAFVPPESDRSPLATSDDAHGGDDDIRTYRGRPVIVTASRLSEPLDRALKSVTVITAEDIARQHALTVADALRAVPALDVQSSGGSYGSVVDIRLRGADTDQVLVLLDGVQVNSTWLGSFNFADMPAENIERIEVVRGPASALYGSQAVGGVINIISRKGRRGFHPALTIEGGSLGTRRAAASLDGGAGAISYSLTLSRLTSDGVAPHDGYRNASFSSMFEIRPASDKRVGLTARYTDGRKQAPYDFLWACDDFWNCTYFQTNDPNNSVENRFLDLSLKYTHDVSSRWNYSIGIGQVNGSLRNVNEPDPDPVFEATDPDTSIPYTPTVMNTLLDTRRSLAGTQHNLQVLPWAVFSFGVEGELEEAERTDYSNFSGPDPQFTSVVVDRTNVACFAQQRLDVGPPGLVPPWKEASEGRLKRTLRTLQASASLALGLRVDSNSQFGSELSPNVAAGVEIGRTGTGLSFAWSESYNAPSLTDLYFPGYSNPELKPETSSTVEVTLRQKLLGHRPGAWLSSVPGRALPRPRSEQSGGGEPGTRAAPGWSSPDLTVEVSYFDTRYDDLIAFDAAFFKPGNVARAEVRGAEAVLSIDFSDRVGAALSYAYQDAKKWASASAEAERLQRRPRGLFNAGGWAGPFAGVSGRLDLRSTSSVEDKFDFIAADGVLRTGDRPGFTTVDLAVSYAIGPKHRLHLKVRNLFDERYEEVKGFPAPGRTFLAGITLSP